MGALIINKTCLLILLCLYSCQSEKELALISDCEGLAMMYYRGLPRPSVLYKKHCQKKEPLLKYGPEKCKHALGQLMLHGSTDALKKRFGTRIMECFNKSDLKRFSTDL